VKPNLCLVFLISSLLFYNCKKEKPVVFSGQLLLTHKYPLPLANRKIEFFQPGSPPAIGINSGSTSSSVEGLSDANGFFHLSFTPGKSTFIVFTSTNSTPLTLSNSLGDTSFPNFSRRNFSSEKNDGGPIYIGKTIDTAIIKVNLITSLISSDTIGLQANTINGRINKEYTGRSAAAGSVIVLDTISNMLFTDFDCLEQRFINTLHAGRKWTTNSGYKAISSAGVVSPAQLSPSDETKNEIIFYFNR
jgi:hypothetical protein